MSNLAKGERLAEVKSVLSGPVIAICEFPIMVRSIIGWNQELCNN